MGAMTAQPTDAVNADQTKELQPQGTQEREYDDGGCCGRCCDLSDCADCIRTCLDCFCCGNY